MARKITSNAEKRRPGIKTKLILALCLIASIMLISCGVSIFEYRRINSYLYDVVENMAAVDTLATTDTLRVSDSLAVVMSNVTVSPVNRDASAIHDDLNSVYYRSLIPGIVTMGVGILLVLMLLFFLLSFYVNPIYKMLDELSEYESYGKRYNLTFDGADQLKELNSRIADISEENVQLRRRLESLKRNNEPQGNQ